jgi:carbon-monoxide dehydrogenase large subunit
VFYSEEAVAALAAVLLRRPVKWIEDRREHFISTTQERDEIWEMEIAVDAEARILGVRGRLIHDNGAYMVRGVNVPYGAASTLPLAYIVPALDLDIIAVATNKVPVTPIRGAGKPQGVFVMERLLDLVARETGLDRAEVRRRNLVPRSMIPYTTPMKTRGGMEIALDAGDFPACLARAIEESGWSTFRKRQEAARAEGRYIGIGVANYVEGTGRGPYEPVTVRIADDGRIYVACGAAAIGQGTKTMLAQIVAEQLGQDMTNVTVVTGDTAATDLGMGTFNSRQTPIAGPSAHAAARKVSRKMLQVAAAMMGVGEQALVIEGRAVRMRGDGGQSLSFADIARAVAGLPGYFIPGGVEPGLSATETVIINDMTYSNGTGVAEVAVDIETGRVTVERLVMVHDCGTVVHPRIVAGQIAGGIAHGLGNALYEHMAFDDNAQPVSTTLAEYLLVGSTEMPARVDLIEAPTRTPLNELGVKGVGETGVLPMAAAIASAIEDALSPFGARIDKVPVSPQEIVAKIGGDDRRARA